MNEIVWCEERVSRRIFIPAKELTHIHRKIFIEFLKFYRKNCARRLVDKMFFQRPYDFLDKEGYKFFNIP